MKPSDVRTPLQKLHDEISRILAGDLPERAAKCVTDHTDGGFPSAASGGGSGHGDPTAAKGLALIERGEDRTSAQHHALLGILRYARMISRDLPPLLGAITNTTIKKPEEYRVYCSNPACNEEFSSEAKPNVDGLCSRCVRHVNRYQLPWPKRHVVSRDGKIREVG